MTGFDLRAHTVLLTVAGSRAYGMHTAQSDVDLKGVALPPLKVLLSYTASFQQADTQEEMAVFGDVLTPDEQTATLDTKLEGSVYGLHKFVGLAASCNPHVLDALFCREEDVRIETSVGRELRENASLFLSMRARHSFGGYARSQLKRIETHRKWLLEPPLRRPERADFGLPATRLIPREELMAAARVVEQQLDRWQVDLTDVDDATGRAIQRSMAELFSERDMADRAYEQAAMHVGISPNFIHQLLQERAYRSARAQFKQYQSWKSHRNAERAALEERFGYDTKHGAHLVRLLRMAMEVVETGQVNVWRGDRDADELLSIRAGEWDYDRLMAFTEAAEATLERTMPDSALPRAPDRERIDALVVDWSLRQPVS